MIIIAEEKISRLLIPIIDIMCVSSVYVVETKNYIVYKRENKYNLIHLDSGTVVEWRDYTPSRIFCSSNKKLHVKGYERLIKKFIEEFKEKNKIRRDRNEKRKCFK